MTDTHANQSRAVVNSALWAAAGDAVGWITELVDEGGVRRRTGKSQIDNTVSWDRMIGGRLGVNVNLPAGTYSDDTQLRLSTSRAIRGNGVFDPEALAKVELTVWQSYALGAGRGSKAAALNLARPDANWFSNFFKAKDLSYLTAGGNGAAMRVQPHVWSKGSGNIEELMLDVARNSVITHGALHGIVGALLHALALDHTLRFGEVPTAIVLRQLLSTIEALPEIIGEDRQLSAFWLPAWENQVGGSLAEALSAHLADLHSDLDNVQPYLEVGAVHNYANILNRIGAFEPSLRGSGSKTAMAACLLGILARELGVKQAVLISANTLFSDTDTIGTMVGALLGAVAADGPEWEIQDRGYIVTEACRLAQIRQGKPTDSFGYPDIATWIPPQTQSDAVGVVDGNMLGLAGLGFLQPQGPEYRSKDAIWQWMQLPFEQSILTKRRPSPRPLGAHMLARTRVRHSSAASVVATQPFKPLEQPDLHQQRLPLESQAIQHRESLSLSSEKAPSAPMGNTDRKPRTIDELTDQVIRSNFDSKILGQCINYITSTHRSVEMTVSFVAIIAKAQISRLKRAQ